MVSWDLMVLNTLVNFYITMEKNHVSWENSLIQLGHGFNQEMLNCQRGDGF